MNARPLALLRDRDRARGIHSEESRLKPPRLATLHRRICRWLTFLRYSRPRRFKIPKPEMQSAVPTGRLLVSSRLAGINERTGLRTDVMDADATHATVAPIRARRSEDGRERGKEDPIAGERMGEKEKGECSAGFVIKIEGN